MLFGKKGIQEFLKLVLEMNVRSLMLELGLVLFEVLSHPRKIDGFKDLEVCL